MGGGVTVAIERVAAGISFTCGIATDGATYCWGAGNAGQLGDGTGSDSSVPVPVADDPGFVHLSASRYHMCGLTAAGAAYCWGENYTGQTGIGVSGDPVTVPTPVAGSISFRALTAGPSGACAVALDGEAYCFGANGLGQLGTGDLIERPQPTRALLDSPATFLITGWITTCAGNAGGGLSCWGQVPGALFGFGATTRPRPIVYP